MTWWMLTVFCVLTGATTETLGLCLACLIFAVAMQLIYASRLARARTPFRCQGDSEIRRQVMLAIVPLGVVSVVIGLRNGWHYAAAAHVEEAITAGTFVLSCGIAVVWASSLVDWFYIRPRREGFFSDPPACQARRENRLAWTKFWVIHRSLATVFGVVLLAMGAYLISFGLLTHALEKDSAVPQYLATLPASGIFVLFIQGFGYWDGLRAHNILGTPKYAVGDVVEIASDESKSNYLLLSMSLDTVDLLDLSSRDQSTMTVAEFLTSSKTRRPPEQTMCGSGCENVFETCALASETLPNATS